jgi:hypothetical protein
MIGLLLVFVAGIAVCVLLAKVMTDWGSRYLTRTIRSMLSDTEQIVNKGKLPEAWVQPFRKRLEAVRRKGGSENKMERIGRKARRRCLRNTDRLIKFFQEKSITGDEETRQLLLVALQERWDWVATAEWQDLLAPEASAKDEAEPPAEN